MKHVKSLALCLLALALVLALAGCGGGGGGTAGVSGRIRRGRQQQAGRRTVRPPDGGARR